MPVDAFRLENFMAFQDTGWIEIRPITLFFGKNSSGKSAIIRALRLLKQSLFLPDNKDEILTFETEELDCGSYDTIAYRDGMEDRDEEEKIIPREIGFDFRCALSAEMIDQIQAKLPDLRLKEFSFIELHIALKQVSIPQRDQPSGNLRSSDQVILSRIILQLVSASGKNAKIVLRAKHLGEPLGKLWLRSDVIKVSHWKSVSLLIQPKFLPSLTSEDLIEPEFKFVNDLLFFTNKEISNFLESFEYMGPIRPEPRRIIALDNLEKQRWEKQGLKTWITYLKNGKTLDAKIAEALVNMKLCKGADVNSSGYQGTGVISEINVTDIHTGLPINLRDVGYGMSQVLPIIATSYQASTNSVVIIEQPELHLHPQAQAELAHVFIEASHPLSNNLDDSNSQIPNSKKFIIETHSEHILLRVRRCIAETASGKNDFEENPNRYLLPENVRVYFVAEGKVQKLEFDIFGDFVKIPSGFREFFSDDLNDVVELTRSRIIAQKILGKLK